MLALVGHHRRAVGLAILLTLAGTGLELAQPLLARKAVTAAGTGALPWRLIALLAAVFCAQALIGAVGRFVLERTGEGIMLGLRRSLVHRLLRLPMPAYDQHRTGDLVARTSTDTTVLRNVIAQSFVDLLTAGITTIGILALMIWLDPMLCLLVLATVVVAALVVAGALRGMRAATEHSQAHTGAMAADLDRALTAIATVRSSRAEHRETKRISAQAEGAYRSGVRAAKLAHLADPAMDLAANGVLVLVMLVGGLRVARGQASLGDLVAFLLYASYLVGPLMTAFYAITHIQRGMGALQRIWDILT
ncbi:ABC transporter ATP-binding protein, partial [Streptomyces swartbergensis]